MVSKIFTVKSAVMKSYLSYDVASGSEITPCNNIDKPLVVYRFTGNVIRSIKTMRSQLFFTSEMGLQSNLNVI